MTTAGAADKVQADAVPQLRGTANPNGSVLFLCAGTDEYKRPEPRIVRCGRKLFYWMPGARGAVTHGTVEIKCRHCGALNVATLSLQK